MLFYLHHPENSRFPSKTPQQVEMNRLQLHLKR